MFLDLGRDLAIQYMNFKDPQSDISQIGLHSDTFSMPKNQRQGKKLESRKKRRHFTQRNADQALSSFFKESLQVRRQNNASKVPWVELGMGRNYMKKEKSESFQVFLLSDIFFF